MGRGQLAAGAGFEDASNECRTGYWETYSMNNRHNGVAFDAVGNQTEIPVGTTSNTADYDGENRLVRVRHSSNTALEPYD